jgi:hypothetical protein
MSISIYIITLQLTFLFSSSTSHYSSPSPPATPFSESSPEPPSSTVSDWLSAHATYYSATDDTRDAVDGACGYGDTHRDGYGIAASAALSETLFVRGQICGACFELRCLEEDVPFDRRWCVSGKSIVVTATNFCAPNYGFDAESEGGHCNPPKQHFVLPVEAFEKIAIWKGGNMPVKYRRYDFPFMNECVTNINLYYHVYYVPIVIIKISLLVELSKCIYSIEKRKFI